MQTIQFEKHLGKGTEVDIDGEKYKLKSLDTESMPEFFKAMKAFGGLKKDSPSEDMMKALTDESIEAIKVLIERTLEESFPEDWKADKKKVKSFGMKYMMVLLPKIIEINSANIKDSREGKRQEAIASMRQRLDGSAGHKESDTGT